MRRHPGMAQTSGDGPRGACGMTLVEVALSLALISLLLAGIYTGVTNAVRLNYAVAQRVVAFGLCKQTLEDSNTWEAQGGIASVLKKDDTYDSHIADTLSTGCGICNEQVVDFVIRRGPELIEELLDWGTEFDMSDGQIDASCTSGGKASGTVSFQIGTDGLTSYVYYELDNVCDDKGCVSGEGAIKVVVGGQTGGIETTVAGDLTITHGDEVHELRYGVSQTIGGAGIDQRVVVWHNGDTWVVRQHIGGDGISYEVDAGNGSWSCEISGTHQSITGSCTGSADSLDF